MKSLPPIVQAAAILAVGILIAVWYLDYRSPYQTCLRTGESVDLALVQFCAGSK